MFEDVVIKIKGILDEDFINYKKPSMFIMFPKCSFKCCTELGIDVCQNMALTKSADIEVRIGDIAERYINNPITKSIVCGGLEPFDSAYDLMALALSIRKDYNCNDDIVIYTGYTKKELEKTPVYVDLAQLDNIIVKFGRFVPESEEVFDEILGVKLKSNNQYAVNISEDIKNKVNAHYNKQSEQISLF